MTVTKDHIINSLFTQLDLPKRKAATGDDLMLGSRRVVTFRCSRILRTKKDGLVKRPPTVAPAKAGVQNILK